ncbi:MAG: leucine-rich repeat protein [Paludibacteraceae bacterium]|nr:leucine-rich repeat protein [Paludibacteraceae bacterium]
MKRNRLIHLLTLAAVECLLLILMPQCTTEIPKDANYLTFKAEADNSTFRINKPSYYEYKRRNKIKKRLKKKMAESTPYIQYSINGGKTWRPLRDKETVTLQHKGDSVLLRGENPNGFTTSYNSTYFTMTGRIAASGSVMSLIDGIGKTKVIPCEDCFRELFVDCASLTHAPQLPATDLKDRCYMSMFKNCIRLKNAPQLPATQLAEACYKEMFMKCASLRQAPELPATALKGSCYTGMFMECDKLVQAPELPATILADYCYQAMFEDCALLTQAPEQLPANKLTEECYNSMFQGCSSLKKAPQLPATKLSSKCYRSMFKECIALEEAPELPAIHLAENCYEEMFKDCDSLRQASELPAPKLKNNCYTRMFAGCILLEKAPELPASTMAFNCYKEMFADCHHIDTIKVGLTKWGEKRGTEGHEYWDNDLWLDNVAPDGTFICPKALPKEFGQNRIPEGWKVIEN